MATLLAVAAAIAPLACFYTVFIAIPNLMERHRRFRILMMRYPIRFLIRLGRLAERLLSPIDGFIGRHKVEAVATYLLVLLFVWVGDLKAAFFVTLIAAGSLMALAEEFQFRVWEPRTFAHMINNLANSVDWD